MFGAADRTSGAGRRGHGWVRWWAACVVAAVGVAGLGAVPANAQAPVHPVAVDWGDWTAGSLPYTGPAPGSYTFTAYLSLVGPTGPDDRATRVSDPTSPDYGHYLNLTQATQAFGASAATRQSVTDTVTAAGGTVNFGPVNTFARASFTVAQAEAFFGTTFGLYLNTAQGDLLGFPTQYVLAPLTQPSLPAALNGLVDAVAGLPSGYQPPQIKVASGPVRPKSGSSPARGPLAPNQTPATPVRTGTAAGCPAALAAGALTPNQLAAAYGYDQLQANQVTGAGVRLAVLEMNGNADATDLAAYSACFGLPSPPLRQVNVAGPHIPNIEADGEAVLDVQVAAQVAPGLESLDLYSYNGSPALESLAFLEQMALPLTPSVYGPQPPDIVSVSYGACEALIWQGRSPVVTMIDRQTAVAVTTGMGYYVSTGDSGSSGCLHQGAPDAQVSASYPSTSPWVTAVGGTALTLNADNSIGAQAVWNDTLFTPPFFMIGGGGGGTSTLEGQRPAWQNGPGVPPGGARLVPDVASFADPMPGWTWYCQALPACALQTPPQSGYSTLGGTSASTPQVAAIFALITQLARSVGQHADPGFVAPLLYQRANSGAVGLNDVIAGNNDVAKVGCCTATPNWDLASGWGSVNAADLAEAVLGPIPAPTGLTATAGYATVVITFTQPFSNLQILHYDVSYDDGVTWFRTGAQAPPNLGGPAMVELAQPNGVSPRVRLRASTLGGFTGEPSAPIDLPAPQGALFTPVTPTVIYDSRAKDGPLASGQQRTVATQVPGGSIPGAVAVAYNLTVTDTVGSGHLSVTPSGGSTNTSAINWTGPGQKLANASVVAASPNFAGIFGNGSLTVAAQGGATQFLVSVVGYYAPASVTPSAGVFTPVDPVRAYDSRTSGGPISGGQTRAVNVTAGGLVPPTATSVAYTLTETETVGSGHLKVSPHGTPPTVSAINWWQSGQRIANSSVVGISGGQIDVAAGGDSTQFLVDILGYYTAAADVPGGTRFTPIQPARAYDSRAAGAGGPLAGGTSRTTAARPPNSGVPPRVAAVAFNLTETATVGSGHLRVAPGGAVVPPTASTINWTTTGQAMANGTVVRVHDDQMTTFASGGSTQYIVDTLGYFN